MAFIASDKSHLYRNVYTMPGLSLKYALYKDKKGNAEMALP